MSGAIKPTADVYRAVAEAWCAAHSENWDPAWIAERKSTRAAADVAFAAGVAAARKPAAES